MPLFIYNLRKESEENIYENEKNSDLQMLSDERFIK